MAAMKDIEVFRIYASILKFRYEGYATEKQKRRLMIEYKDLSRQERLDQVSVLLGRTILSFNDIFKGEAMALINLLNGEWDGTSSNQSDHQAGGHAEAHVQIRDLPL